MILMPEQIWASYNINLESGGVFASQLLGVVLLGIATISWFSRNIRTRAEMMMVIPGFFIAHAGSAVLGFTAMSQGIINSMVWVDIFAHLLFAAGFGYYFFVKDSTR